MKTLRLLLILSILAPALAFAITPPGTYTFAPPCMPFGGYQAVANTYGCYSFTATNAGANDPNGYYSWDFGDGSTATGTTVLHCYSPVTVTTVFTGTVWYNGPMLCGPLPLHNTFTISLSPPPSTPCIGQSPFVTLAPPSVTVLAGSAIPEILHIVNFGDGTASTSNPAHTYVKCGNYIITVKSWDMNGPPGDTCYQYAAMNMTCTINTTGTWEYALDKETSLFPNPAHETITLHAARDIKQVLVKDICGRTIIKEATVIQNQTDINVSHLLNGTYFVEVTYSDNSQQRLKFVKL